MNSEKNIDISVIQKEIESIKRVIKPGSKLKKRLEDLENNLLVGMVSVQDGYQLIMGIKKECGEEVKAKTSPSHNKDSLPNFYPKASQNSLAISQARNTRNQTCSLPLLINKVESLLMETLFTTSELKGARLAVFMLAETYYELMETQKIYNENDKLQELLADEISEYDERIESLREARYDLNLLLDMVQKYSKYLINQNSYKQLMEIKKRGDLKAVEEELMKSLAKSFKTDGQLIPLIFNMILKN